MNNYFDFEKPIIDLLKKIDTLKKQDQDNPQKHLKQQIKQLEQSVLTLQRKLYAKLTPWEKTLMARHIMRPTFGHYVDNMVSGFFELKGDRIVADDPAIKTGFGRLDEHSFAIIGHDKGRTEAEKKQCRNAQAKPEGYRKAIRIMSLAEKFSKPVLTLVDTPSADMGQEAEERGQAQILAQGLYTMAGLKTLTFAVITGEGGSGGAIALAVADHIMAQANAIYSVISPEGCAAIIYRDAARAPEAAASLKITAEHLLEMGIIDEIIPEPLGGAHLNYADAASLIKSAVMRKYVELSKLDLGEIMERRHRKFRAMGIWGEKNIWL